MHWEEYRKAYYEFSAMASERSRQLAYAGIAVIWVFRSSDDKLDSSLIWPLGLFVAGLFLDLIQYVVATLVWRSKFRKAESAAQAGAANDAAHSSVLVWPMNVCFAFKVVCVLCAYCCLLSAVGTRIHEIDTP